LGITFLKCLSVNKAVWSAIKLIQDVFFHESESSWKMVSWPAYGKVSSEHFEFFWRAYN
jgi:hypothetical protein